MPNYDGTGPFGSGRPGRGLGPCGRFGAPGWSDYGPRGGRAFGRGFARGRGFGFRGGFGQRFNRYYDAPEYDAGYNTFSYAKEDLLAMKKDLERQTQWINEQLSKDENS